MCFLICIIQYISFEMNNGMFQDWCVLSMFFQWIEETNYNKISLGDSTPGLFVNALQL